MVRVAAFQVVDVQRDLSVIDEALKKLVHQIDIEFADARTHEIDLEIEAGAAGKVDHHARQRFVERNVSVAVAAYALLVAERPRQRLSERDADVLDRVMRVDVQIAPGRDFEIEYTMARNLVEHVIEKRHPGVNRSRAAAVEINPRAYPRLIGVACDFCSALAHIGSSRCWR